MSSIPLKADPQALLLQKNSPAPYAGLLAPVNYIKDLEQKAALAKMYKQTLDKNTDCLPELSSFEPRNPGTGFWEGALVGIMTSVLVVVIVHK